MSKKINGEDIRRFSKGILKVMIDRRISSLEDFKENVGRYPIGESGEEVVIEPRPSSQGTLASTISYIVLGLGVLIEVRINQELGYSRITLKKSGRLVEGYSLFYLDSFGNTIQIKSIGPGAIDELISELENLSS